MVVDLPNKEGYKLYQICLLQVIDKNVESEKGCKINSYRCFCERNFQIRDVVSLQFFKISLNINEKKEDFVIYGKI